MSERQLPHAASVALSGGVSIWGDPEALKRAIAERKLTGLANNTKWNELLNAMREQERWRPSYRFKTVLGKPGAWDVEWSYHPPFPLICVAWMDIATIETRRSMHAPFHAETIDHAAWISPLLTKIGFDTIAKPGLIRIFGYAPRDLELFED